MTRLSLQGVILLFFLLNPSVAFVPRHDKSQVPSFKNPCLQKSRWYHATTKRANTSLCGSRISVESYEHKDLKLTYLYKKAAHGRENDKPIVLVHPVGVGLSSWFWVKLMEAFEDNPPIYAPDLIGCGLYHGADPWDPDKRGLFFPLSWVEGIEALVHSDTFPSNENGAADNGCLVVVQGGLAPVGIMLAHRNPHTISALMLTSPPTYNELTTAVRQDELERNYNFLRSPILGSLAFSLLENKEIIRFFSNLFLFTDDCDDQWLDETQKESRFVEARTPVQAFNAGLLQHRSFEAEMKDSKQQKMIVSGDGDKRVVDRQLYATELLSCTLETIEGTNVLPWENSEGTVALIKKMGY